VAPIDWTLCITCPVPVHVQTIVLPDATVSTAGCAVPLWTLVNTMFPTVTAFRVLALSTAVPTPPPAASFGSAGS